MLRHVDTKIWICGCSDMYTSSPFIFIICEEGFFGGDCCLRVVRRDSFVDLITSRWNWMCFAKNSDWRYVTSYITRTRPCQDEMTHELVGNSWNYNCTRHIYLTHVLDMCLTRHGSTIGVSVLHKFSCLVFQWWMVYHDLHCLDAWLIP